MKVVHIVGERFDDAVSGATLRNSAINAALTATHETLTIFVSDLCQTEKGFPTRTDAYIAASFPAYLLDEISRQVVAFGADVAVVEGVFMHDVAERLKTEDVAVIVDAHNHETALLRQIDRAELPFPIRSFAPLLKRKRWQLAAEAERRLAQMASDIWVCSEQDRAGMANAFGSDVPIHVLPNPMPAWCLGEPERPDRSIPPDGIRAIFVGHLGYRPNKDAVRSLLNRIMPAIRRRFPHATIAICGRAPNRRIVRRAAGTDWVRLVASPPDLRPCYRDANLVLVPLKTGGGTRIKVLEALALGLPVIATAKAVEGIGLVHDEHYLCAESPGDYLEAVTRLVEEPETLLRLRGNGRRFVEGHHSQKIIELRVAALLAEFAERREAMTHG